MTPKERRQHEVSALANIIKDCAIHDAEKTIKELQDRCSALESLLAECGTEFIQIISLGETDQARNLIIKIDAILPKPPEEI